MANSATHQSDLKHKGTVVSISNDRISDLLDSLICHILSFLPTKKAIATSILSSRWRPLWTLVPKIDLRDNPRIRQTPVTFTLIAYRFLALHTAPLLWNFRLTLFTPCDPFHLDTWIRTVIGRKVEQLHLEFYFSGNVLELPITVFTCKTIVNLELRFDIVLVPPNFQFPSLKTLCLYRTVYKYDYSFPNLISGCPVLEDLTVALREGLDGATNYNINVPTLKRIDIDVESDYKFEIYAPVLHYFRFFGDLGSLAFLEKLTNLVEAHVYIYARHCVPENGLLYGARVFKLVRELNCSKFLSLCPGQKEVVRLRFTPCWLKSWLEVLILAKNTEVMISVKNTCVHCVIIIALISITTFKFDVIVYIFLWCSVSVLILFILPRTKTWSDWSFEWINLTDTC